MEITKTETGRGFVINLFKDRYDTECSIQKSSLATEDAIWIGVNVANPKIMASTALEIGMDIGGKGLGKRYSFAQYIARELSRKIKNVKNYEIEGSFISDKDLVEISFKDKAGKRISSSLTGRGWDLSIFRYKDK